MHKEGTVSRRGTHPVSLATTESALHFLSRLWDLVSVLWPDPVDTMEVWETEPLASDADSC